MFVPVIRRHLHKTSIIEKLAPQLMAEIQIHRELITGAQRRQRTNKKWRNVRAVQPLLSHTCNLRSVLDFIVVGAWTKRHQIHIPPP
jgi:hypothetical protein